MKNILKVSAIVASSILAINMANASESVGGNQAQVLTIDSWQKNYRGEGLGNMYSIMPNMLAVNAQDVFPLNYQAKDFRLHEIPSVARLISHPAVSSMVVINKNGDVLLEHYKNGKNRNSTMSDQSSTKSIGYILLNKALKEGKIALDDKIEKYIPEIGAGFKGRSIADVAAMAVFHQISELAAYAGDPEALKLFDRDERVIGLQRNDIKETLIDFIADIGAGGKNNSNVWEGDIANYATINTNVLGLALERATGVSLASQIRHLFHEVGGENIMYMGTDFDGIPMIGASMISSPVDFARYGRLLISDAKQAISDRQSALKDGEVVPPELTYIESRYYKSAIHNKFGLGHSGWGGQLIWADPESGTIVAVNSQMDSKLPAPYDHFHKLYNATYDIIKLYRAEMK